MRKFSSKPLVLALGLAALSSLSLTAAAKVNISFNVGFGEFDGYMSNTNWWNNGYAWRRFYGYIPSNAVAGGYEPGRTLYICQAYLNGVQPGKVVAGNCNITYGGQEIPMSNFRILVGNGFRWRWSAFGNVPGNAVPGGYEKGRPLYICQARYADGIHPGKIVRGNCNIGYNGSEIPIPEYRVLTWRPGYWGNDVNWNNWYISRPPHYRPWIPPTPPFPPGPPFPPSPPHPTPYVPPPPPPPPPHPTPFGPPGPGPSPFGPPGPGPTPHPTPFGPPGPGPSPFGPPAPPPSPAPGPSPFGPPPAPPKPPVAPFNPGPAINIPGRGGIHQDENKKDKDKDQNLGGIQAPKFP